MSMSRAEHHRRAQELLGEVDPVRLDSWTQRQRDTAALAQLHATLAAAPAAAPAAVTGEVAVEYPPRWMDLGAPDRDLTAAMVRLERALEELEDMERRGVRPMQVSTFIRERVLGGGQ